MKKYTVIVHDDGCISWGNEKNQLHCEHGPAIIWPSGAKEYYIEGKRHRLDGPAVEYACGSKEYFIEGDRLTEEDFNTRTKPKGLYDGKVVEVEGKKYKLQSI